MGNGITNLSTKRCATCGAFIDEHPSSFPRYCSVECTPSYMRPRDRTPKRTIPCPSCARKFVSHQALAQHTMIKHAGPPS
jgi:endogenous inhibitor of DNA gyrase (YacG/DUF329 family)